MIFSSMHRIRLLLNWKPSTPAFNILFNQKPRGVESDAPLTHRFRKCSFLNPRTMLDLKDVDDDYKVPNGSE